MSLYDVRIQVLMMNSLLSSASFASICCILIVILFILFNDETEVFDTVFTSLFALVG